MSTTRDRWRHTYHGNDPLCLPVTGSRDVFSEVTVAVHVTVIAASTRVKTTDRADAVLDHRPNLWFQRDGWALETTAKLHEDPEIVA
jgi:hypothetical protein